MSRNKVYDKIFASTFDATKDLRLAKRTADEYLRAYREDNIEEFTSTCALIVEADIQELTALDCIPKDVLSKVKSLYPKPFFAIMDVGGVGISRGTAKAQDGQIYTQKVWSFSSIKSLSRKLLEASAKIIYRHSDGNTEKSALGSVVHSYTKKVGDSLRAFVVAHIIDEPTIKKIKDGIIDICSVEANISMSQGNTGEWYVKDVNTATAVALACSSVESPGFKSASILAHVQELEIKNKESIMSKEDLTLTDVQKYLVENPTEFWKLGYQVKDIVATDEIKNYIDRDLSNKTKSYELEVAQLKKDNKDLRQFKTKTTIGDFVVNSKEATNVDAKFIDLMKRELSDAELPDSWSDGQKQEFVNDKFKQKKVMFEELGLAFVEKKDNGTNGDNLGKPGDNQDVNPLLQD